ncbi:MAG TPA: hypothetical protein VMT94_08955 [Burkholderiales bacterium]|nr:hypothetical protein [Burkholderiales bacterium]
MTKDEIRKTVAEDIRNFRAKAQFYESARLFEAASYAKKLASNLELALTTLPSDEDPKVA